MKVDHFSVSGEAVGDPARGLQQNCWLGRGVIFFLNKCIILKKLVKMFACLNSG